MTQVSFDPKRRPDTPTKYVAWWHFLPFLSRHFFSYTTLSGVYFNGKKYLHFVLNNICEIKIIFQFPPLACKWDDKSIPMRGESPWGTMSFVHLHLTKFKILHSSQSMVSRASTHYPPTSHCTFSFHFQLFNNWMKINIICTLMALWDRMLRCVHQKPALVSTSFSVVHFHK